MVRELKQSSKCEAWRCEATSKPNPFFDSSFFLTNLDSSFTSFTTLRIPDSYHAVGLEPLCRNTSPIGTRHRSSGMRTGPSLFRDPLSGHGSRLLNAGVSASGRLRHPDSQRPRSSSASHSRAILIPRCRRLLPTVEDFCGSPHGFGGLSPARSDGITVISIHARSLCARGAFSVMEGAHIWIDPTSAAGRKEDARYVASIAGGGYRQNRRPFILSGSTKKQPKPTLAFRVA